MRLATLITNTDDSDFARARPDDGEKFASMIASVRPGWTCQPFWVCRDTFPEDISAFDGVMITGSPASTQNGAAWIVRLEALIVQMISSQQPLFGACFGHQLIAKALGCAIVPNPQGWGHGRLNVTRTARASWSGETSALSIYGSHCEQVATLPPGAELLFEGAGLAIAGYRIGSHVFTIQHHPEMDHAFISDLVEEYAEAVGPDVTRAARASLQSPVDNAEFRAEIARFFETVNADAP